MFLLYPRGIKDSKSDRMKKIVCDICGEDCGDEIFIIPRNFINTIFVNEIELSQNVEMRPKEHNLCKGCQIMIADMVDKCVEKK